MDWKVPAGILLVPILATIFWFAWTQVTDTQKAAVFSETGNIVKDTPGLESGVWHLLYEEPGKPALSKKLYFDKDSRCLRGGQQSQCDMSFQQGERVKIEGELQGDAVRVLTLEFQI